MRWLSTLLDVIFAALIAAGVGFYSLPAGLICAGILGLGFSFLRNRA